MTLKRATIVLPVVQGLICGAIGVSFLALSVVLKGPEWSFVPLALFVFSIPCLLAAIVYLIAAFLLARTRLVWRTLGVLLDAAASLAISGTLVLTSWAGDPAVSGAALAISIAFAVIWIGACAPVLIGVFRPTVPTMGSTGSAQKITS
jgi:hypothetical protein